MIDEKLTRDTTYSSGCAKTLQQLQQKIKSQNGFLTTEDIEQLSREDRLCQLLVRCGACRFLAPAQCVQHLIDIIQRDNRDYVRDVSLPAKG